MDHGTVAATSTPDCNRACPQVPLVVSDITKEVGLVPSPFLPPSLPPPSRPPSPPAPPFTCLDFESMNEVRETGQWCSTVARDNDPEACNNAYAITFPSDNFSPGYFSKPRRYRTPDVRVQRQRCTHNNLEGPDAKCKLDDRKYQCAVPRSVLLFLHPVYLSLTSCPRAFVIFDSASNLFPSRLDLRASVPLPHFAHMVHVATASPLFVPALDQLSPLNVLALGRPVTLDLEIRGSSTASEAEIIGRANGWRENWAVFGVPGSSVSKQEPACVNRREAAAA
eukprot:4329293-Pleurochrysis_carterae.AAC.2